MKYLIIIFFSLNIHANEYYLKSNYILDVKNLIPFKEHYLYIKDQKILELTNKPNSKIQIIDLKNNYILPGLIDSHSHLFITQTKKDKTFANALMREASLKSIERTDRARKYLKQYLQEGFTTVFDLGNSGEFLDVKLRNEVKNDPDFPLMLVSGPGVATSVGQFSITANWEIARKEYTLIGPGTNVNELLENYLKHDVDIIKIYLDNAPGDGAIPFNVLKNILNNSLIKKFKKVTFHSTIERNFSNSQSLPIENLEHFYFYSPLDNLDKIKFITSTDISKDILQEFNDYTPVLYKYRIQRTSQLSLSKVKLLFGPDFYYDSDNVKFNRAKYVKNCLDAAIESKLTNEQILKSMTLFPAESVHMENQIGVISPNALANLIVVKENPLVNISTLKNVLLVVNKGKIVLDKIEKK